MMRYRIGTRMQALSLRFEGSLIHSSSRHRVVGTATRLWPGRSGFGIPTEAKTYVFFKRSRPTLRPTQFPILKVPGSSREWLPGLSFVANLHLVTRLQMNGVTPLFLLSAFVVCTGKNLLTLKLDPEFTRCNILRFLKLALLCPYVTRTNQMHTFSLMI